LALKLKSLLSEFNKNSLILFQGSAVAQILPILVTPILTRIYLPADFGVLAIFISINLILGIVSSAKYELSILLPKKDSNAVAICFLGMGLTSLVSIVVLVIIIFFRSNFSSFIEFDYENYLYFLPISIWFYGFFNNLNFLCTRKKLYKEVAYANIFKSIVLCIIQLSFFLIVEGPLGLILGYVASQITVSLILLVAAKKYYKFLFQIEHVKNVASRYIDFPKFSMPGSLVGTLAKEFLIILISFSYGNVVLGLFSMSQRILGGPVSLIGNSIGQVYFEQATKNLKDDKNNKSLFLTTLLKLVLISGMIFIPLFFIVEDLFIFMLGTDWSDAGYYAKILIPFYAIRFISAPLSLTVSVYEKNIFNLIINIILLITSLIVVILNNSFETFLILFSVSMSLLYLSFVLVYYRLTISIYD
jgi:O-antigen/teichoic acid export membrane protein